MKTLIKKHQRAIELLEKVEYYKGLLLDLEERLSGIFGQIPSLKDSTLEEIKYVHEKIAELESEYKKIF